MKAVLYPTYFPSIAQFVAMTHYDVVLETTDNYQKQTYRNRMYVYGPEGKQMLSIPVKHTKKDGRQLYKEVRIEYDFDWRKQHRKTLETVYRSSPFFEFYEDEILPIFEKKHRFLIDLNMESLQLMISCLELDLSFVNAMPHMVYDSGLIDLRYLSDAKKNKTVFLFEAYDQVFQERQGFIVNLSILDLLFNQGPNAVSYLERQNVNIA